jgi:glycosyltransferase involved in cell wall biosynthesis
MQILFVIPNLFRGGAEYQLVELCRSLLAERDVQLRVLAFYSEKAADLPGHYADIRDLGIPLDTLYDQFVTGWPLLKATRRYLAGHPTEVIQTFLQANLYVALAALGRPGRLYFGIRSILRLSPAERLLCRLLDRRVAGYVGNARHATTVFCDQIGAPEAKRATIYNGIDAGRFAHPRPRETVRAELGLPMEARVLITVANLHHPQKGHDDLLAAWEQVAADRPGDHLLLVGTGGRVEGLRDQVRRAGLETRTHFVGARRDVPDLLAASDLYVSPSWVEGFSNAVAEAILAGLPVVATRVGGTPEMLEGDPLGTLVEARDPQGLAAAMALETAKRTPEQVWAFAERVSLERLGREYLSLYRTAPGLSRR